MPNSTRPPAPLPELRFNSPAQAILGIDQIRLDCGTQQRAQLDQNAVDDLADCIKRKLELPPVDIVKVDGDFILADGFHRLEATKRAGKKVIRVRLFEGSLRDAILHSCRANHSHGLRRSNSDKRKTVTTLIADSEWSQWSDGVIAEVAGVSQNFVRSVRSELSTELSSQPAKRIGKDGKARPVKRKTKIQKAEAFAKRQRAAEAKRVARDKNILRALRTGELGSESNPSDDFIASCLVTTADYVARLRAADACRNCGGNLRDDDLDCVACHEPFEPPRAPVKRAKVEEAPATLPMPAVTEIADEAGDGALAVANDCADELHHCLELIAAKCPKSHHDILAWHLRRLAQLIDDGKLVEVTQ